MVETEKIKSIKRFGARYGRTVKYKFGKIENEQRKKHKCPYCNAIKVRRVAVGIWNCRKCGAKFTGKAYSIKKKITFRKEAKEEPMAEQVKEQTENQLEEIKEVIQNG